MLQGRLDAEEGGGGGGGEEGGEAVLYKTRTQPRGRVGNDRNEGTVSPEGNLRVYSLLMWGTAVVKRAKMKVFVEDGSRRETL